MSKSILKQSSKIGFLSLISRCIAFIREWLLIQYFSVGDTSDIFYAAFRIPNTMRKIFAEGALASILVPACISIHKKEGDDGLNKLTTLSLFIIQSIIFLICSAIFYWSFATIKLIVPGFSDAKIAMTAHLLRILISFILFISSGAIIASALQSQKRFFIPAVAPSILNIAYISSLIICLYFKLSIDTFCWYVIATSVIYFLLHVIAYFKYNYKLQAPTKDTYHEFKIILLQLIPCIISVGIGEINHFINTGFASYLASGSMTLIRSSFQFVNIPVGIITASLVTVLLPHFSKLHLESPQEVEDHLFEAIKFTIWTTMPICFMLFLFSEHIFETLFIGDLQALSKIALAKSIFNAYLIGLLSFSLNKIFLSIFYALRLTMIPMIASIIAIAANYCLSEHLINYYGASGVAFAASLSAIIQTLLLTLFLSKYLNLSWSGKKWIKFILSYLTQLTIFSAALWFAYRLGCVLITQLNFQLHVTWLTIVPEDFLHGLGIWFWVGPLCLMYLIGLYLSRNFFNLKLSYFD
ncbi:murein biosynthesis integral membrane protein MurJ [Candidatus Dependentiae bacterium]|nr:murein biosynthesis integral membrane protein MurJ [Candidatus Dependentiae bacterium]